MSIFVAMFFKKYPILLVTLLFILFGSCKTKFEQIRESNNIALKYKEAMIRYDKKDYASAIILFEDLNTQYRGRSEAEDVAFYYAYAQYHYQDYHTARELFKTFYTLYPESEKMEEALYMTAFCTFKLSPKYSLDQYYTTKAMDAFQLYLSAYPKSKKAADVNKLMQQLREKLEHKAYQNAIRYYNIGDYRAAVIALKNCARDHPDTQLEDDIMFYTLKSQFLYAQHSIEAKKEERFREFNEYLTEFKDKYPESKFSKELENIILLYNKHLLVKK